LFCGLVQELQTSPDGSTPKPHDISICLNCGFAASYGEDLQLVPLTSEQQEFTETDPMFQGLMAALRKAKGFNKPT
jgi:hypothetical protein